MLLHADKTKLEIREAYDKMLKEEFDKKKRQTLVKKVTDFIKKNKASMKDEEAVKSAEKIVKDIKTAKYELEVLNAVSNISNLLSDEAKTKHAKEIEKIIDMVR